MKYKCDTCRKILVNKMAMRDHAADYAELQGHDKFMRIKEKEKKSSSLIKTKDPETQQMERNSSNLSSSEEQELQQKPQYEHRQVQGQMLSVDTKQAHADDLKARRERAMEKLREKREKDEEELVRMKIEKEKERRAKGKIDLEAREKRKEMEALDLIAQKKRDQKEAEEAKARVLEQIKADKEARKRDAAAAGLPPLPLPSAPPAPMKDYKEAKIQIRLPSGDLVKNTFPSTAALSEVRSWLEQTNPDLVPFSLLQPFPRKVMSDDDMQLSLSKHCLAPSGSLVVTRAQ